MFRLHNFPLKSPNSQVEGYFQIRVDERGGSGSSLEIGRLPFLCFGKARGTHQRVWLFCTNWCTNLTKIHLSFYQESYSVHVWIFTPTIFTNWCTDSTKIRLVYKVLSNLPWCQKDFHSAHIHSASLHSASPHTLSPYWLPPTLLICPTLFSQITTWNFPIFTQLLVRSFHSANDCIHQNPHNHDSHNAHHHHNDFLCEGSFNGVRDGNWLRQNI